MAPEIGERNREQRKKGSFRRKQIFQMEKAAPKEKE